TSRMRSIFHSTGSHTSFGLGRRCSSTRSANARSDRPELKLLCFRSTEIHASDHLLPVGAGGAQDADGLTPMCIDDALVLRNAAGIGGMDDDPLVGQERD